MAPIQKNESRRVFRKDIIEQAPKKVLDCSRRVFNNVEMQPINTAIVRAAINRKSAFCVSGRCHRKEFIATIFFNINAQKLALTMGNFRLFERQIWAAEAVTKANGIDLSLWSRWRSSTSRSALSRRVIVPLLIVSFVVTILPSSRYFFAANLGFTEQMRSV